MELRSKRLRMRYINIALPTLQAAEIASRINQKKEMGCKAFEVVHVDENSAAEGKMLRTLGATICEKKSKGTVEKMQYLIFLRRGFIVL